jgi:hypothetical protein
VKKINSILPLILGILLSPLFTQAQVIVTVAGTGTAGFSGDGGQATAAQLNGPFGVALDDTGNLYICDNSNLRIRKMSPSGIISTIAGNGTLGSIGNGGSAVLAQIRGVAQLATDNFGNIYIADGANYEIRKVTPDGVINKIAGTGTTGFNGDGIPATDAQLAYPIGVAVDGSGNIYIADKDNFRIRKVNATGIITTIAGTGVPGYSPDGSKADTAKVQYLYSVVVDKNGNVLFRDNERIRRIDAITGIISTVAGNGTPGYSGDGGPATAASINSTQIALDTAGNIYISDPASNRIRRVNAEGTIETIAGVGIGGYSGDGYDALMARMYSPSGVAVSKTGEVYIGDQGNHRIRLVTSHVDRVQSLPRVTEQGISIYPNPSNGSFSLQVNATSASGNIVVVISDVNGKEVDKLTVPSGNPLTIDACWPIGVYVINASIENGEHFSKKIVVE